MPPAAVLLKLNNRSPQTQCIALHTQACVYVWHLDRSIESELASRNTHACLQRRVFFTDRQIFTARER
jgi:hypothetical protein